MHWAGSSSEIVQEGYSQPLFSASGIDNNTLVLQIPEAAKFPQNINLQYFGMIFGNNKIN